VQLRVDDLGVPELRLEIGNAAFDEALALARRLVFGVLGKVAVRARVSDRLIAAALCPSVAGARAHELDAAGGDGCLGYRES
jgi:hypothetical protein